MGRKDLARRRRWKLIAPVMEVIFREAFAVIHHGLAIPIPRYVQRLVFNVLREQFAVVTVPYDVVAVDRGKVIRYLP